MGIGVGTCQKAAEVRGVTHTGFGGMVGVRGVTCELFQLASMNVSFASRFLATLLADSYHPSGSSKSGAPLPSRATLFCVVGSRPLRNLTTPILLSLYSARSISSVNRSMYSYTESLPWYQLAPSSRVRAESCSFFGVKWSTKSVLQVFPSGQWGIQGRSLLRTFLP